MKLTILTLFPESFDSFIKMPVPARAIKCNALDLEIIDIKKYAGGSFRHIDDSPFGGGPGMVMRAKPVLDALEDVKARSKAPVHVAALSPAGSAYTQCKAHEFAKTEHLVLICGHYEGMDERIYKQVDEEISIGDYILTGGEAAAAVIADSVIRLLPGALRSASTEDESFENGLLEYPQYTQPADIDGDRIPDILLSGNHEAIRKWRLKESLRRTAERRPDLLSTRQLTKEESALLKEIADETAKQ